ncbi:hypothetical protein [Ammoniphilus oxalaticus]|nr:hypothetical protein [Ammoniphilus oxalaticus]
MAKQFLAHPLEVFPMVERVLKLAHELGWDEDDLYLIAKTILVHIKEN